MQPIEYHRQKTYMQELQRELDEIRLAEQARQHHTNTPVYGPVLARVGSLMKDAGSRLEERYGDFQTCLPCNEAPSASIS